jgi:hypothetical protein
MPGGLQSSFIPKQALEQQEIRPSQRPVGLLFVLAFIILLVSGIVLGGSLLYQSLLKAEIEAPCVAGGRCGLRASVELERKNIDQITIEALRRLDQKLAITDELLKKHNSILALFKLLEKYTLPSVAYTSFNFSEGKVQMDGLATSYEDIAVQTQIWDEAKRGQEVESFIFSDLNRSEGLTAGSDRVRFKLTIVVAPALILAENQSI